MLIISHFLITMHGNLFSLHHHIFRLFSVDVLRVILVLELHASIIFNEEKYWYSSLYVKKISS